MRYLGEMGSALCTDSGNSRYRRYLSPSRANGTGRSVNESKKESGLTLPGMLPDRLSCLSRSHILELSSRRPGHYTRSTVAC